MTDETARKRKKMKRLAIAGISLAALAGGFAALPEGTIISIGRTRFSKDGISRMTEEEYEKGSPITKSRKDYREMLGAQESIEGFVTSVDTITERDRGAFGPTVDRVKYSYVELNEIKTFLYPLSQNTPRGGHRININYVPITSRDTNPGVFDRSIARTSKMSGREVERALDSDGVIVDYKYVEGGG